MGSLISGPLSPCFPGSGAFHYTIFPENYMLKTTIFEENYIKTRNIYRFSGYLSRETGNLVRLSRNYAGSHPPVAQSFTPPEQHPRRHTPCDPVPTKDVCSCGNSLFFLFYTLILFISLYQ